MIEKTEQDHVQEALDRASRVAQSGSREARSGRFDDLALEQQFAQQLVNEAHAAARSWAHWQAINEKLDSELQAAARHLDLTGLAPVRAALARDAVLIAFRLSDAYQTTGSSRDQITICRAAALIGDSTINEKLNSRQWVEDLGYPEELIDYEVEQNSQRLKRLRACVVTDWSSQRPDSKEFIELREAVRPTRNRLAHAIEGQDYLKPTVDQISAFVRMTLELATNFALVMNGSAFPQDSIESHVRAEADKFWSYAFTEPLRLYRRDTGNLG